MSPFVLFLLGWLVGSFFGLNVILGMFRPKTTG